MPCTLCKMPCLLLLASFNFQLGLNPPVRAGPSGSSTPPRVYAETTPLLEASAAMANTTTGVDYCAQAAKASNLSEGFIPYNVAKGCYEMFAFDPRIRDDTIKNVRYNLESFYVFYDIAKYG